MGRKEFMKTFSNVNRYEAFFNSKDGSAILVDRHDRLGDGCSVTETHYKVYVMPVEEGKPMEAYWKGTFLNLLMDEVGYDGKVEVYKYGPDADKVTDSVD